MNKTTLLLALLFVCGIVYGTDHASAKSFGYIDTETNRTFVPLRYLTEQFQCEVMWDAEQKKIVISRDDVDIEFAIGHHLVSVNGEQAHLEEAPFIEQDVTYVPLRFLSQSLHIPLEWNHRTQSITIQEKERLIRLPLIKRGSVEERVPFHLTEQTFKLGNKQIRAHVLAIDLLDPDVQITVGLAQDKVGQVAELQHIAESQHAIAAVNGTFFDAYSDSETKVPYGFIVRESELVHPSTEKRAVFAIHSDDTAAITDAETFTERLREDSIQTALQAGPLLLTEGSITVDPENEGFRDPKILTNVGARSAIGVTHDHYLLLVTTRAVTIPELAELMLKAGAVQAMNLDGGASSGLYYNGSYVTKPGRMISNALIVQYRTSE